MLFKETIQKAGLTIIEGAKVLGISRPTFYNWENGVQPRVQIQYRAACHAAALLQKAIDRGRLPLKDTTMKQLEKVAAVKRIMKEMSLT